VGRWSACTEKRDSSFPFVCVRIPAPWSCEPSVLFLRSDRAGISKTKPNSNNNCPILTPSPPPTSHITPTPRSAQVTTSSVSCSCPLIVEAEEQIVLEITDNNYSSYMLALCWLNIKQHLTYFPLCVGLDYLYFPPRMGCCRVPNFAWVPNSQN
jgi:hypothetical protein